MNIEELKKLHELITETYNKEKNKQDINSMKDNQKQVVFDELSSILKEQKKVEELIEIYKNQTRDLIIAKLEKLYIKNIYDLSENSYLKLTDDKRYQLFDECFPDDWPHKFTQKEKEDILLESISSNKLVKEIIYNKKNLKKEFNNL